MKLLFVLLILTCVYLKSQGLIEDYNNNAITQNTNLSSDEIKQLSVLQIKTIRFVSYAQLLWGRIYCDTNESFIKNRFSVYDSILASPYLKKDKFKINQIHNYIKKISKRKIRTGNIYYQTEIEIKIPFPIFSRYYGISSERDLIFEFTRKLAPNNYRKLKLKRVIGSKQIIIDYEKDNLLPPIFVDEIEIEKFFSNFFDRLALKISEPYKILSKELRKHYYEIKDQRYIAEYYLKLNGLTFIDDRSIVMCSRYIIYKYYPTIESTQQTGWLIYDEGPSEDYPEDIISSSNN